MNKKLSIVLKSEKSWMKFSNPLEIYVAHKTNQILSHLKSLDAWLQQGKYVAGFLSYEAAPGLDSALSTKTNGDFPLMVFGVFDKPDKIKSLPQTNDDFEIDSWIPSQTAEFYKDNVKKIKDFISKGDTYQVNYTMRLSATYKGSPYALFYQLVENQKAEYSSFIEFDKYKICSVSPELFFRLDGDNLLSRPMKGTAARGLSFEEDMQQKRTLYTSKKERAENLMIVDMIRNDMGKICKAGSIEVRGLYNTERYPTVWQMTSDVFGKTNANFSDIIEALFPCASITGAPKARTTEIINELEQTPRHIYTGSIGYFSPERKAQFNVAIRTVLIDSKKKQAEYGVGGGIVWDSVDKNEYEECLLKAKVLKQTKVVFQILETMLVTKQGIFLLDYHLDRLKKSAEYFNYVFKEREIRSELKRIINKANKEQKLRLLLFEDGTSKIEQHPLINDHPEYIKVCLAHEPVNNGDLFLYHKTTNRRIYKPAAEQAKSQKVDDIILYNQKGEITESTIANIVIKKNNNFYTPPVTSGLLNGTFRQYLISQNKMNEKVLFKEDIITANELFLINSVKKWQKVRLARQCRNTL